MTITLSIYSTFFVKLFIYILSTKYKHQHAYTHIYNAYMQCVYIVFSIFTRIYIYMGDRLFKVLYKTELHNYRVAFEGITRQCKDIQLASHTTVVS